MTRPLLTDAQTHPAIREAIARYQTDLLAEVQQAIASHPVVVVGMRGNPFVKQARKQLQQAGIAHHYLEYGSYFSQWRRRLALKMWTGWPTFPMVFVRGMLVGGAQDVQRLTASGDLQRMLA